MFYVVSNLVWDRLTSHMQQDLRPAIRGVSPSQLARALPREWLTWTLDKDEKSM